MTRTIDAGPRPVRRVPDDWQDRPYERITLDPYTPIIGAEVGGVDVREPLDDATFAELHRALLEWKVLFFRDQRVTGEQHRAFAARWGELEVHPFLPQGDVPHVVRFEHDEKSRPTENVWHTDVTWRQIPSLGSVLRAVEVPAVGGDTMWADMGAAYDGLPEDVKARIEGMVAVHDFTHTFGQALDGEQLREMQAKYPPAHHPVVRTHPETGRKTLFVNDVFTSHIVGVDRDESDALLEYLGAQARVPEYQCRFHWRADSIAFWDNRATQHYAAADYWPDRRVMERATIIGDQPY